MDVTFVLRYLKIALEVQINYSISDDLWLQQEIFISF